MTWFLLVAGDWHVCLEYGALQAVLKEADVDASIDDWSKSAEIGDMYSDELPSGQFVCVRISDREIAS